MVIRLLFLAFLLLAGCVSQPYEATPSHSLPAGHSTLGQHIARLAESHPQDHSGFRLLASSTDAFNARGEMIRAAEVSLDIQYYIVDDGLTTRGLVADLLDAADRGVRVRILLDDTASDGVDRALATLAAHPNIEIRVFNPIYRGRGTLVTRLFGRAANFSRQHRRMHNKLMLADSNLAIVGGRNLGDVYFDADQVWNFMDMDLLGAGPIAARLGGSFDEYWNHRLSVPIQRFLRHPPLGEDLREARDGIVRYFARARVSDRDHYERLMAYRYEDGFLEWLEEMTWAPGEAYWDSPDKILAQGLPPPELLLVTELLPVLEQTRDELVLISGYFVPTADGVQLIRTQVERGIQVAIMTNALEATDVPLVHGGYAPYRHELLEMGVRLFELRRQPGQEPSFSYSGDSESSLHSKAAIIDGERVFIGSLNFDPRSVWWNTEVGILVDSPELAREVHRLSLEGMAPAVSYEVRLREQDGAQRLVWVAEDDGEVVLLEREPGGLWRHVNAWMARILGLENLL
ncbi:phospholipase D family protein [Stutzerimonas tarimensis]|uniref:Phospholipase D family protein n=1 Tax=Stutzerimonas tarimensis TaxID=1507735 RepID=A0ABV7T5A1_9GAMM